jgi:hypothetical protein
MPNKIFIKAEEIAQELGVYTAYAYKLVRKLNEELERQGFITIVGRISKKYYQEKFYGIKQDIKEK